MPLPLLLIGVAAAGLGLFGAKKGYDAYSDNTEAEGLNQEAKDIFDKDEKRLQTARTLCTKELEALGQLKFEIWERQLGRFVSLMEQLRNVELRGSSEIDHLGADAFSRTELAQMKELSGLAAEVVSGGITAVGTGALVGMASYGGATMFATASTGTAISSLSGAAATNATLAWFGGGAIASGGMGIAGGMAVLGGLVAGPVLAVGGMVLAAKARKNLAAARSNHAQAKKAAGEMRAAASVVNGIREVAGQFRGVLTSLDERTTPILDDLEEVLKPHGLGTWRTDYLKSAFVQSIIGALEAVLKKFGLGTRRTNYDKLAEADKRKVHLAFLFAQGLKIVLEAPLLTKEGALTKTYPKALEHGRRLLNSYS